ncbi:MAG: GNAT family N-acetyltransferase [Bradymonadaceae bacterium]
MVTWQTESSPNPYPILLQARHRGELEAFLGHDIPLNLFFLSWIEKNGVEASHPGLYHFQGLRNGLGDLTACSLVISNRLILLDTRRIEDAQTFGRWYRERGIRFHHIVSARRCVAPFWQVYHRHDRTADISARLIQDQEMFVLHRTQWYDRLNREGGLFWEPTELRTAQKADLDALFLASARMHQEETLEDPLAKDPDAFRRHIRHRIAHGRSFVWYDDARRLIFKADISAHSRHGAQISGVFTLPSMRGQGLGTRAMHDLCHQLFEQGLPLITLYVNTHNESAKRVYTRVGFRYYADYQTVFVAV